MNVNRTVLIGNIMIMIMIMTVMHYILYLSSLSNGTSVAEWSLPISIICGWVCSVLFCSVLFCSVLFCSGKLDSGPNLG